MAKRDPVTKVLDRLLMEDGVMGYQVRDGEVVIFVEDDAKARALGVKEIQGRKVTIKVSGKFTAF